MRHRNYPGEQTVGRMGWVVRHRRLLYPKGHADLAASLNNVGVLLWARGNPAGAEKLYRDCLALYRELRPDPNQPDLARLLSNLGVVRREQGDLAARWKKRGPPG